MDRNQIIGLVLLGILFFVYFQFFAPEPPQQLPEEDRTEPVEQVEKIEKPTEEDQISQQPEATEVPLDTLQEQRNYEELGIFSAGAQGSEKEIVLQNKDVVFVFSSKGGILKKVELKHFHTYDNQPLFLMDEESSTISLVVNTNGQQVDLYDLYYNTRSSNVVVDQEGDTSEVVFNLDLGDGKSITQTYRLGSEGYQLGYDINLNGLEQDLATENAVFQWVNHLKKTEKNIEESRTKATVNYYLANGDFDGLKEASSELEEEQLSEQVYWVAFKQKFFTSAIINNEYFNSAFIRTNVDAAETEIVKNAEVILEVSTDVLTSSEANFTYFFGPNNFKILNRVAEGFSDNIYLGWTPVNWVNKILIINIFHWLENFIGNYGLIIFILVLIVKMLLLPLSYKSYISMAKTKVLKPELDEIKEKHGGDMQKVQSEQMKLYQQVGVNPISGCIPMLLQMPILFAMFYFFPNSIELRQESFLWADDLSTYDSVISWGTNIPLLGNHLSLFTVLMTLSTILYTWSNNQMSSVQGPMKSMGYIMPVVFLFVLNSFPAALTYYYFLSNLITFAQQALIRKFVDEDKIRSILDENKLKNRSKKKSIFQLKLEEAMKANDPQKKRAGKK